jgi:tetratricopeptide (TPR) repeat protein
MAAFDRARLLGLPHRMLWYQFQPYVAYLQGARYDEVLLLTETILDNAGGQDIEETFYYRGLAYQGLGEDVQAAKAFQRALEIKPHFEAPKKALLTIGTSR